MTDFFVVALPGLAIGAVYALLGLGIVLANRVARVVNLAQGEYFVVGALLLSTLLGAGVPVLAAAAVTVLAGAGLAAAQETLVLRRMRGASAPVLLLTTVAFALSVQGVEILLWGRDPRTADTFLNGGVQVGGVGVSWQVLLLLAAVAAVGGLVTALQRSRAGRAMAAVAEDPDAARMTGIDVFRLRLAGLLLAGAIGGLAGALALPVLLVDFTRGLGLSLRGFVAAVAGRYTVGGTVAAGLALGAMESLAVRYISSLFRDVIVFGALVAIILLLPALNQWRRRPAT